MSWVAARRAPTTRDESIQVVEPTHETEFEIQAELWSGLRRLGFNARGEVRCQFAGRAQVRFDVAVFDGGALVGVIECKREGKQAGSDWSATRQGARYSQFGVPIRLVRGMGDVRALLADAEEGKLWSKPP